MKSVGKRLSEFCEYHKNGDGECNTVLLCEWARRHELTLQEKYELAIFFSITYCVESAIILFEKHREAGRLEEASLLTLKPLLVFQSDRKYMAMKDSFQRTVRDFYETHPVAEAFLRKTTKSNGEISLERAIREIQSWVMYGRFAAFLFLEMFVALAGLPYENTTIDWKNGNTATSGLLNLFGYDREAAYFDQKGTLIRSYEEMDKMLQTVVICVRETGGNANVTQIETSLCAYRKLYKGSRYNGYYLDRMLEELVKYEKLYPELTAELYELRGILFSHKYLGEKNKWNGIRPKMKKYYLNTGAIN